MSRFMYVRPRAKIDADEILEYLRHQKPSVVAKFGFRYLSLLKKIERQPFLFAKHWRNVRAVRVPGFKYIVFYVVLKQRIDVICVCHGFRESSFWKSRL